jgi:hypothetical protein
MSSSGTGRIMNDVMFSFQTDELHSPHIEVSQASNINLHKHRLRVTLNTIINSGFRIYSKILRNSKKVKMLEYEHVSK